jgi:sugar/nucleoside kinase (ribokinase family)
MRPKALFVGLCTLDVIQSVDHVPAPNEKLTALRQTVAAGGPATNAAAAFSHLGGAATLLTGIGSHPLTAGITADLARLGVPTVDLDAASTASPTVSSILVTAATGERAVASTDSAGSSLRPPGDLDRLVADADVVELDGHHMDVALDAARLARASKTLTLFDGGSWKERTGELLPLVDVAVCSADFRLPGTTTAQSVLDHLTAQGVRWAAVSRGDAPILWAGRGCGGEIDVPAADVVDTLGAGDVLHGALAFHLARHAARLDAAVFAEALRQAARVATRACTTFGTRAWMHPDQASAAAAERASDCSAGISV